MFVFAPSDIYHPCISCSLEKEHKKTKVRSFAQRYQIRMKLSNVQDYFIYVECKHMKYISNWRATQLGESFQLVLMPSAATEP